MTNALAQNIKTKDENVIDSMIQAINLPSQSKNQDKSGFSNIINGLESKTQKVQSNFDKKAKVTNVSSINKKALNKKEAQDIKTTENKQEYISKDEKETKKTSQINPKEEISNTKTTENKKETKEVKEENQQEKINNEKDNILSQTEINKEDKNLSDINNSSPVETSPVFSFEENTILNEEQKVELENTFQEIEKNAEELLNFAPISNETIKVEIDDLNEEIKNIETTEDIKETIQQIENISSNLDNSTLNQDEKTQISKTLEEVKSLLNNAKENFEEIFETEEQSPILNKISDLISDIKIEKNIEQPKENLELPKNSFDEAFKEIKDLIKEIKNIVSNFDSEKVDDISKKISQVFEKIETISNEKVEENINIDSLDKLAESLKNLQNTLKENFEVKENEISALQNKNTTFEIKNDISIENEKLAFDDKNVNSKNQDTLKEAINLLDKLDEKVEVKELKEVINLLDNLDENIKVEDLNKELKTEVENLIQNINENNLSTEEINQVIDDLSKELKTKLENQETITSINEKTSQITQEINDFSDNQEAKNNMFNNKNQADFKEYENKNLADDSSLDLSEISNDDFNQKEIKIQKDSSKNADIETIEENIQKTIALDNMLDEMMVEVDIKTIPSQSGALSVADEITKLAMGETNSLNSTISPTGSITYDSTGINAVIKNISALTKTSQMQNLNSPSMEDILNQVANKVTQLKDSNVQKLTMVLRPNDLGRLSINLTSNQQGVTTQIMAQNEDVRAYIEKNIDSLRQQLSDAGVNVNSIQIKTVGTDNTTTYDGNQNLNNRQEENLDQRNSKEEKNNQQNNNNKNTKEMLASMSNYDMSFAKDFSGVLAKSLNYNLN